ncbi:hypothetical protein Poly59_26760 [Rubripirellula reticaptiva]|uniref:Uncharacterized protein n=1 Tax=Rubripirellula reticaptiva TaxID=2528013 RepID=A0A5C6F5V6_9BACT|nr:hypothetical protein Poly59_26760 [Rubripirellula reticaptiva]
MDINGLIAVATDAPLVMKMIEGNQGTGVNLAKTKKRFTGTHSGSAIHQRSRRPRSALLQDRRQGNCENMPRCEFLSRLVHSKSVTETNKLARTAFGTNSAWSVQHYSYWDTHQ